MILAPIYADRKDDEYSYSSQNTIYSRHSAGTRWMEMCAETNVETKKKLFKLCVLTDGNNVSTTSRIFTSLNKLRTTRNSIWADVADVVDFLRPDTSELRVLIVVTICHPTHRFLRGVEKPNLQPLIDILWN